MIKLSSFDSLGDSKLDSAEIAVVSSSSKVDRSYNTIEDEKTFLSEEQDTLDEQKQRHIIIDIKKYGKYNILLKSLSNGKFKVDMTVKNARTKKTILDCNRILYGTGGYKHAEYSTEFNFTNDSDNPKARGTLEMIFYNKSNFWNRSSYYFKIELVETEEKEQAELEEEIEKEFRIQLYVDEEKRNRILRVDEDFESLNKRLTNEFGSRIIKYKDSEDELVSIYSDDDLKIFLNFLKIKKIEPKLHLEQPKNLKRTQSILQWQKGQILGSGGFAKVYEGLNQETGTLFAVKEINLNNVNEKSKIYGALQSEIKLLSTLDHPNIVRYLGFEKNEETLCFFLEFMSGGSLESKCHSYMLPENVVRNYTYQILHGLNYLHSRNILHRDVKTGNVLLDSNGHCCLSDFGSAEMLTNELKQNKLLCGTPNFMAPEVISSSNYSIKSDIYSLGCTVLELLTGNVPFYEDIPKYNTPFQFMNWRKNENVQLQIPKGLSKNAKGFLEACLQFYPENRPTTDILLEHPFITGKD
eukprot:gene4496-7876_t